MISFKSQLPINNKAMIFYLARNIDIIRAVSSSHLALCGPTLACSNDDEAWI